jgi:hypothetical protein
MLPLRSGWNCQYLSLSEPCEKGKKPATFSGNPLGTDTTPEVDSGKKGQGDQRKTVTSYKSILETSLNEPIDKGVIIRNSSQHNNINRHQIANFAKGEMVRVVLEMSSHTSLATRKKWRNDQRSTEQKFVPKWRHRGHH